VITADENCGGRPDHFIFMQHRSRIHHRDIKEKVSELLSFDVDWQKFVRLGNLTKLQCDKSGTFRHANYESGLLLYAIVRHFQPRRILEIGTGRGYGSICMAHALRDAGITGQIITIDTIPYEEKQPWPWPIDDGSGPRTENLSVQDVWERHFNADLRNLVEFRAGSSVDVMAALQQEGWRADFVYIDGDHTFASAKHDFFASLLLCNSPFRMLLDDYTPHSHSFGVRRMVDRYVAPIFQTEAIYNDRRWFGEEYEHEPVGNRDNAQVFVDSTKVLVPLDESLPRTRLSQSVESHRRWGWAAVKLEHALKSLLGR